MKTNILSDNPENVNRATGEVTQVHEKPKKDDPKVKTAHPLNLILSHNLPLPAQNIYYS